MCARFGEGVIPSLVLCVDSTYLIGDTLVLWALHIIGGGAGETCVRVKAEEEIPSCFSSRVARTHRTTVRNKT